MWDRGTLIATGWKAKDKNFLITHQIWSDPKAKWQKPILFFNKLN
jgi:hypothetical protein